MAIGMKHLERIALEEYFAKRYEELIREAYYRYCEFFCIADEEDSRKNAFTKEELATSISLRIEHADGLCEMAVQIFGKSAYELSKEIDEKIRNEWHIETNKSKLYLEMVQFLRGW